MSFWAVTVITSLLIAIPVFGSTFAEWLWGGYAVDNPTLNRFFSFHYLLPFIAASFISLHLLFIHSASSDTDTDDFDLVTFYPYFYLKDLIGAFLFILYFIVSVFFYPDESGHCDNYFVADPNTTPLHLSPEWYFLPFYTVLRIFPDKLGGLAILLISLVSAFDPDGEDDDEDEWVYGVVLGSLGTEPLDDLIIALTQFIVCLPLIESFIDEDDDLDLDLDISDYSVWVDDDDDE
jgi:quinol-cytochrome oxidoreductase complex cytochrome b subunit